MESWPEDAKHVPLLERTASFTSALPVSRLMVVKLIFWLQLTWHFTWLTGRQSCQCEHGRPRTVVHCLQVLFSGMHFLHWGFDFEHNPLLQVPMEMHFSVIWVTYVYWVKIIMHGANRHFLLLSEYFLQHFASIKLLTSSLVRPTLAY